MYKTKQKQILISFFEQNIDKQYSIKEITDAISKKSIGISTIYRLINKMSKDGLIRRFRGKDGKSVLYQYIGEHNECKGHFHLKCNECGILIHLNCDYINSFNNHINKHHKFDIDMSETILYGICSNCKKGV